MDEWTWRRLEKRWNGQHVGAHQRRYFCADYRSRADHRLRRASLQFGDLHDLLRVLGLCVVRLRTIGACDYAQLFIGPFPLALDRKPAYLELLAIARWHAVDIDDSNSSQ